MKETGERKTRSDKKIRVNAGLSARTHSKLQRLALACGTSKTELAAMIIESAMNSPSLINSMQDYYKASEFRIIPMTENGQIYFVNAQ